MKKLLVTLAALAAMASAQAVTTSVVVDSFTDPNPAGRVSVFLGDTTYTDVDRSVLIDSRSTATVDNEISLRVGGGTGTAAIGNVGGNGLAVFDWAVLAGALPSNATGVSFYLTVVSSDPNPVNLELLFNGGSIGTAAVPGSTSNQDYSFGILDSFVPTIGAGGALQLRVTGAADDWDLTIDALGFQYDPALIVPTAPEPGSLALVGLALAGIAAARRRKA